MGSGREFHVGPHIMIIGPDQKMLETLNHDGSNGEPYVNHLPGHAELFLVIPIRQWNERQLATTSNPISPGPHDIGVAKCFPGDRVHEDQSWL